jgi:hypothetical protein
VRGVGGLTRPIDPTARRFLIDQMCPGAGRAGDPLVLVFENIWIVIQLVLDVEAGRRAPENELTHLFNLMTPRHQA